MRLSWRQLMRRREDGHGLRARPRLLLLTIGGTVLETLVVWGSGLTTSLGLAAGVTAPAPFDIFHDVRWLAVYHWSWPSLVWEAALFLAFRSVLDTALILEAWPLDRPRPAWGEAWRQCAAFTAVAALLVAPWVTLLFAMAVVSISWLAFIGVPGVFVVAVLVHHGAVSTRWWRERPALRSAGWMCLAFLVLSLDGAALTLSPLWLRVPVATAAGLFNAWAWVGVVGAVVSRRVPQPFRPLPPVGVALFGVLVAWGTALGFDVVTAPGHLSHDIRPPAGAGQPVLIVGGFDSKWNGVPHATLPGRFDEQRFSYLGLGVAGEPLAYTSDDTHQSLPVLDRLMAVQVAALAAHAGQPVNVVAESEGSLVAETYLLAYPGAPVRRLVLLSPLVQPARVYYPRGHDGWGVGAGWGLRAVAAVLEKLSPVRISTDTPLFRSMLDEAPAIRTILTCPVPGVTRLALFPLADAVAAPHPTTVGARQIVVPAFHGGLLGNPAADRAVALELEGRTVPRFARWALTERLLRAVGSAWQVPVLPLTLNRAWDEPHREPSCADIARRLQATVR
jgi:hypothetical protein